MNSNVEYHEDMKTMTYFMQQTHQSKKKKRSSSLSSMSSFTSFFSVFFNAASFDFTRSCSDTTDRTSEPRYSSYPSFLLSTLTMYMSFVLTVIASWIASNYFATPHKTHMQGREDVDDALQLVHDLRVGRILQRAGVDVLDACVQTVLDAAKRNHFIVDLRGRGTKDPLDCRSRQRTSRGSREERAPRPPPRWEVPRSSRSAA